MGAAPLAADSETHCVRRATADHLSTITFHVFCKYLIVFCKYLFFYLFSI